jgi:hypothetical protein
MLPEDESVPFVLDQLGGSEGDVRLIDTGPGDLAQLRTLLRRVDHGIVPVRLETMTLQALNKFLPVVEEVQAVAARSGTVSRALCSRVRRYPQGRRGPKAFAHLCWPALPCIC